MIHHMNTLKDRINRLEKNLILNNLIGGNVWRLVVKARPFIKPAPAEKSPTLLDLIEIFKKVHFKRTLLEEIPNVSE